MRPARRPVAAAGGGGGVARCLRFCGARLCSHAGLCGLVVAYSVAGAVLFERLERSSAAGAGGRGEDEQQRTAAPDPDGMRTACLDDLWNITGESQTSGTSPVSHEPLEHHR